MDSAATGGRGCLAFYLETTMKMLSRIMAGLGFISMFFALFIDLPIVSGDLEAGKWAFIASTFAMAAWVRMESMEVPHG